MGPSVYLTNTEGTAYKMYQAEVVESQDQEKKYDVIFTYGRIYGHKSRYRGNKIPLDYSDAMHLLQNQVYKKIRKGYQINER
jgi:hypothetical protein